VQNAARIQIGAGILISVESLFNFGLQKETGRF